MSNHRGPMGSPACFSTGRGAALDPTERPVEPRCWSEPQHTARVGLSKTALPHRNGGHGFKWLMKKCYVPWQACMRCTLASTHASTSKKNSHHNICKIYLFQIFITWSPDSIRSFYSTHQSYRVGQLLIFCKNKQPSHFFRWNRSETIQR